jgi:hypothetical protein
MLEGGEAEYYLVLPLLASKKVALVSNPNPKVI